MVINIIAMLVKPTRYGVSRFSNILQFANVTSDKVYHIVCVVGYTLFNSNYISVCSIYNLFMWAKITWSCFFAPFTLFQVTTDQVVL